MSILTRKLLRTIQATRGQFLALVVIVTLGVVLYIGMTTSYYNLSRSQQQFYQDYGFADYNFMVVKAPESVVARVEALPGVVKATGRMQKDVPIIKDGNERITGRLTGYPLPMENEVNRLHLLSGRPLDRQSSEKVSALVDPQYAQANGLTPGQEIEVIADGKKVTLVVTGTATSPEFIYPMKDAASLFPEPERFGILMVSQFQAQQMLGLPGQINQLLVDLAPGVDEEEIKQQIEKILEPYGNISSFPRGDQSSHVVLQAELDGIQLFARSLPFMFFLVAAAIQFIILTRMIRSQRLAIGVMKALGYNNRRIMWHYTAYGLAVGLVAATLGSILGMGLATALNNLFAQFFNLPAMVNDVNIRVVLYSFLITSMVGMASGLLASRSVIRINPAEAMRTQPPAFGRRTPLESWPWLWKQLSSSWKMSLRSIFRNRGRFVVTVLGIISSVVLLVFACFSLDATDYLMNQNFKQINRYDYLIRFTEPIKYTEILDWNCWDEVQRMEPMMELPVKLYARGESEDEVLVGMAPSSRLKRVYDKFGQEHQIPDQGILISKRVADKLGLQVGDEVKVETTLGIGPSRTSYLTIMGINEPMIGSGSYVSLDTANSMLGEQEVASAVLLKLDKAQMPSLENRLQEMSRVGSVTSPTQEQETYEQLMGTATTSIAVLILFAGLLGLAIIYNTSVMTFNERERELASLRVLGYSRGEVAGLLRQETWIQAVLGIGLGLPTGKAAGAAYMASASTDLYSFPVIIYPRTYFIVAGVALIFVWIGLQLANRKVRQLDMVEALKNQD
ncbi:MAG TPA: ABC transporter permease [Gelria sp.]|nr:ABC transporter permease [Gelria sp.]